MPEKPGTAEPRRRWYQFSLRALLIAVAALSVAAWVCALARWHWALQAVVSDYVAARDRYYEKWVGYESGTVPSGDVCAASSALFDAEVRFGGGSPAFMNALQAHIERLKALRDKVRVPPDFATNADPKELQAVDDALGRAWRQLKETGEGSN